MPAPPSSPCEDRGLRRQKGRISEIFMIREIKEKIKTVVDIDSFLHSISSALLKDAKGKFNLELLGGVLVFLFLVLGMALGFL